MTCKQIGGACDIELLWESFDEIANQSKKQGMEIFQKGDTAHIDAMNEMQKIMKEPTEFAKWFESIKEEFNNLNNNSTFQFPDSQILNHRMITASFVKKGSKTGQAIRNDGFFFVH